MEDSLRRQLHEREETSKTSERRQPKTQYSECATKSFATIDMTGWMETRTTSQTTDTFTTHWFATKDHFQSRHPSQKISTIKWSVQRLPTTDGIEPVLNFWTCIYTPALIGDDSLIFSPGLFWDVGPPTSLSSQTFQNQFFKWCLLFSIDRLDQATVQ